MLLENATKNAEALRTSGERAIRDAKRAGAPVYYMDAALGEGIIKELPDGTRQKVLVLEDEDLVVETLVPSF